MGCWVHYSRRCLQRCGSRWNLFWANGTREAAVDSAAYTLVRRFYERTRTCTRTCALGRLFAPLKELDPEFRPTDLSVDEPLRLLVSGQPSYLIDRAFGSWDADLIGVLQATVDELTDAHGSLENATHGTLNTLRMRHPLASGIPVLGRWLNMPETPWTGIATPPMRRPAPMDRPFVWW